MLDVDQNDLFFFFLKEAGFPRGFDEAKAERMGQASEAQSMDLVPALPLLVAWTWHRVKPPNVIGSFLISILGIGQPARPTSKGCYGDKIRRHLWSCFVNCEVPYTCKALVLRSWLKPLTAKKAVSENWKYSPSQRHHRGETERTAAQLSEKTRCHQNKPQK